MSWTTLSYAYLSVLTSTKMTQGHDNAVMLAQGLPEYAADTGAADALACTLAPAPTAYTAGQRVRVKAAYANTGAATIDVNALGAKTIKKRGGAADLVAGDIVVGQICVLEYDGTNFQLTSDRKLAKADISTTGSWGVDEMANLPNTQEEVSGTHSVGTAYQNTTGRSYHLSVSVRSDADAYFTVYSDGNADPIAAIGLADADANKTVMLHFIVLPGNYYKITCSAGTPTDYAWTRWK